MSPLGKKKPQQMAAPMNVAYPYQAAAAPQQYRVHSRGWLKPTLIVVVVLVAILAGIVFAATRSTLFGQSKTIDLTEYILTPQAEGRNGFGEISPSNLQWNEEGLKQALQQAHAGKESDDEAASPQALTDPAGIVRTFGLDVAPAENLSNGDTVVVTIVYKDREALENNYDVKFTGDQREFVIAGLTDLQQANPFEHREIVLKGVSPYATVSLDNDKSSGANQQVRGEFQLSVNGEAVKGYDTKVKIGDEISYTLTEDSIAAWNRAGFTPSETTLSKTVSTNDVASYAQSYDELDAETLDYIAVQADDLMKVKLSSTAGATFEYRGFFFITPKEDMWKNARENTPRLFRAYEVSRPDSTKPSFAVVRISNIVNEPYPAGEKPTAQNRDELKFDYSGGHSSLDQIKRDYVDANAFEFRLDSGDL